MQKIKRILKNANACMIAALVICLALANGADAQPYVQQPATPDSLWFIDNSPILGLNTAMINVDGNPMNNVFACTYYDGSGSESIHVNDFVNNLSRHIHSTSTIGSVPDAIIGNYDAAVGTVCSTCTSTQRDYIMATAFADPTLTKVLIDLYDVYDDHSATLTITPIITYTVSGTYSSISTVHIDEIAEAANTLPTGRPLCDKYVVTWDDFSGGPNVYAAYGSLNTAGAPGSITQINPSSSSVYGYAPDVAAVQRIGTGGVDDVALITYVDAGGNKLYYSEWDITSALPPTSPVTLDDGTVAGSGITGISAPRIDAIDNFTRNSPLLSAAVYKVAAQVDTTISGNTYPVIRTYDNYLMTFPLTHFTCSDDIDLSTIPSMTYPAPTAAAAYYNYAPTVALGAVWEYRVQHVMNYNNMAGNDILFMEPTEIDSPNVVATDSCYWINTAPSSTTPSLIDAVDCSYANSVSCSPNLQGGCVDVYAWGLFNQATNRYEVHYKIPTAGSIYAFKPGQTPASVSANVQGKGWEAYPNPAANMLTVSNTDAANAATGYEVLDMAGRGLQAGVLQNNATRIDVSMLAPGTYVLRVSKGNNSDGQALFVKE